MDVKLIGLDARLMPVFQLETSMNTTLGVDMAERPFDVAWLLEGKYKTGKFESDLPGFGGGALETGQKLFAAIRRLSTDGRVTRTSVD